MVAALRCVRPQLQWYQLACATEMESIQLHDCIVGLSQKIVFFTLHYITSHHITSHHITSHHITSHHITSHHITLHHITLHYIHWAMFFSFFSCFFPFFYTFRSQLGLSVRARGHIAEVSALLSSSPDTSCDLDPIPTSLLKQCKSVLLPTITNIMNLSLSTGVFPDQFQNCSVHPLLKPSNLDKENLSNYRPISHLSYLSKLTERLAKNRLADHLNENNLVNSFQSANTKFNSTETTWLVVHDHIIRAMSQQQVTGLCFSWSFCRLWQYWPYHSSTSTQILVWFHWHCLILDSVLPFISFLYCWYQWHQISSL